MHRFRYANDYVVFDTEYSEWVQMREASKRRKEVEKINRKEAVKKKNEMAEEKKKEKEAKRL